MSRFYKINITNNQPPLLRPEIFKFYGNQLSTGLPDTGALAMQIDAPITMYSIAENAATVTLWGINYADIGQAANFVGMVMDVYGGMQQGLPLANPKQAGLLLHGRIQQCYSNWIGTEITLHFVVMADTGTIQQYKNFNFVWRKGQYLSDAITNCINNAFNKQLSIKFQIGIDQIAPQDINHNCDTLRQFASFLKQATKAIGNAPGYNGVDFYMTGTTITVFDYATGNLKPIAFIDMIGQPSWISASVIQLYCVLRGDLSINDLISLPNSPIQKRENSYSQYNVINYNNGLFSGTYQIIKLRHIGNSRSLNALDWITVIDCVHYNSSNVKQGTVEVQPLIQ